MSPLSLSRSTVERRFPRVSGDEPARRSLASMLATFSPRERG